MIIVANICPLIYLILINSAHLLENLFVHVLIPPAVFRELQELEIPDVVRS